jgi:hypothetical protein
MRTYLFVVTIWLLSLYSFGQPLTNGQVFDFDIGDTIQTASYQPWNNYKFVYKTDVIINKVFSNNNNTVSYSVSSSSFAIYFSPLTSSYYPISDYNIYSSVRIIPNLSSPATLVNNSSSCIPLKDTTYTNSCGKLVWMKMPITVIACSTQFFSQNSSLIAGLGGPYYDYSSVSGYPPEGYSSYALVYYSKVSGRCGSLMVSVDEAQKDPAPVVYPNPCNGKFIIQNPGRQAQKIQITDLNGRLLVEQQVDQTTDLDVRDLKPGMYHLLIGSSGQTVYKKLLIAP